MSQNITISPTQKNISNRCSDFAGPSTLPDTDYDMQRSAYMPQPDGFDARLLILSIMGEEIQDLDCTDVHSIQSSVSPDSNYWGNPDSILDEPLANSSAKTICEQQPGELVSSSLPFIDQLNEIRSRSDPMVNGYYQHNDYRLNGFNYFNSDESKKVIVKHIEDDEELSEINPEVAHLEDHSYVQNTPVSESDNSVTYISNNSESEIDVCTEPQPVKITKKYNFKSKPKYRSYKKIMTYGSGKQTSKLDKSYHNELERKRRQEQRDNLDRLRMVLGLPQKSSKMNIINGARHHICELRLEMEALEINLQKEIARKNRLSAKLSKLMERKE